MEALPDLAPGQSHTTSIRSTSHAPPKNTFISGTSFDIAVTSGNEDEQLQAASECRRCKALASRRRLPSGAQLPPCWTEEMDRFICQMEAGSDTVSFHGHIVDKAVREQFAGQLDAHTIAPGAIERRLACLELQDNDYFKQGMRESVVTAQLNGYKIVSSPTSSSKRSSPRTPKQLSPCAVYDIAKKLRHGVDELDDLIAERTQQAKQSQGVSLHSTPPSRLRSSIARIVSSPQSENLLLTPLSNASKPRKSVSAPASPKTPTNDAKHSVGTSHSRRSAPHTRSIAALKIRPPQLNFQRRPAASAKDAKKVISQEDAQVEESKLAHVGDEFF